MSTLFEINGCSSVVRTSEVKEFVLNVLCITSMKRSSRFNYVNSRTKVTESTNNLCEIGCVADVM